MPQVGRVRAGACEGMKSASEVVPLRETLWMQNIPEVLPRERSQS